MWFGSSKSHDCSVFAVFVAVLICLVPVAGPDRPMLVKIDHLHKFKCIEESFFSKLHILKSMIYCQVKITDFL